MISYYDLHIGVYSTVVLEDYLGQRVWMKVYKELQTPVSFSGFVPIPAIITMEIIDEIV